MFDKKDIKRYYCIVYRRIRNFLLSAASREFLVFLFFVLVAFCFWLLQTLNDKYQAEFKIPLRLKDVPKEIVMTSEIPDEVRVRVEDRGTVLLNYMLGRTFFPVVFSFNDYKAEQGGGHVCIPTADVVKKVASQLNNTTRLVAVRPDTVDFIYSYGEAKKVPVAVNGSVVAGRQYYVSETRLSPDSVVVFAPKDILESLSVAYTRPFSLENVTDTVRRHLPLQQIRGAKFVPAATDLTVYADMYSEKTLEIPVVGLNFPSGKVLRTFPSRVQVTFQVGLKNFRRVTADDFFICVSYEELLKNKSDKISLTVKRSPDFVNHIRMNPASVDYLIEQQPGHSDNSGKDD